MPRVAEEGDSRWRNLETQRLAAATRRRSLSGTSRSPARVNLVGRPDRWTRAWPGCRSLCAGVWIVWLTASASGLGQRHLVFAGSPLQVAAHASAVENRLVLFLG